MKIRSFDSLNERERRMVVIGGVCATLLLVFGVIVPLDRSVAHEHARIAAKQADLVWMRAVAPELIATGPAVNAPTSQQSMLVVVDHRGTVRGAAGFTVHSLDPPFAPTRRALVGRFALDETCPAASLVPPLVALACRLALARGAAQVELTDLPPAGTDLHEAVLATGSRAWSRVVIKSV